MGTLAACAVSGTEAALAQQTVNPAAQNPASERSLPVGNFNIAAGLLADALREFERASGWKIQVPDKAMHTIATKAVSGVMPAPQALRQLLGGTGLTFSMNGATNATLRFEERRDTVDVSERMPLA